MVLQLANHCSIALNQEMLLLLHPFADLLFLTTLLTPLLQVLFWDHYFVISTFPFQDSILLIPDPLKMAPINAIRLFSMTEL